jgi:hypothetical protein
MQINKLVASNEMTNSLKYAFSATLVLVMSFMVLEPVVTQAVVSNNFTIKQQITDEISFFVQPANVTMVGAIMGMTGGTATGTTYAVVRTNSNIGYTMDITYSGNPAMVGDATSDTDLRNYGGDVSGEPSYTYAASTSAQFGYTVAASTTSDLDPSFLNNGSACNTGAGYTVDSCWKAPSTTAFRIVNRSTSAPTGATTSLTFKVVVPSNPTPALDEDYYTATATLTALNK